MRLLSIDNSSDNSSDNPSGQSDLLQTLSARHDVTALSGADIEAIDALVSGDSGGFDGLILTGSYGQGLAWDQPYFMPEVSLLQAFERPVLGIGLGFELICYHFGCQLHETSERQVGAGKAVPTADGAKLFQGSDPILLNPAQRWNVDELPRELVVLARSETGIEAIRHKTRPVYGLQLAPEDFKYPSDAKLVYRNIFDQFEKPAA